MINLLFYAELSSKSGGFGGCILGLVRSGAMDRVIEAVNQEYEGTFGNKTWCIPFRISNGFGFSNN